MEKNTAIKLLEKLSEISDDSSKDDGKTLLLNNTISHSMYFLHSITPLHNSNT